MNRAELLEIISRMTTYIKNIEKQNEEYKKEIDKKEMRCHFVCNTCFNCAYCKMPEYACQNALCPE